MLVAIFSLASITPGVVMALAWWAVKARRPGVRFAAILAAILVAAPVGIVSVAVAVQIPLRPGVEHDPDVAFAFSPVCAVWLISAAALAGLEAGHRANTRRRFRS